MSCTYTGHSASHYWECIKVLYILSGLEIAPNSMYIYKDTRKEYQCNKIRIHALEKCRICNKAPSRIEACIFYRLMSRHFRDATHSIYSRGTNIITDYSIFSDSIHPPVLQLLQTIFPQATLSWPFTSNNTWSKHLSQYRPGMGKFKLPDSDSGSTDVVLRTTICWFRICMTGKNQCEINNQIEFFSNNWFQILGTI